MNTQFVRLACSGCGDTQVFVIDKRVPIADEPFYCERCEPGNKRLGRLAQYHWESISDLYDVPPRYTQSTLDNFKPPNDNAEEIRKAIREWIYAPGTWTYGATMIMCGSVGTGKTHLGYGILEFVPQVERLGKFVTVSQMMRDIKSSYDRDEPMTERMKIQSYIDPELLIIDEIGVQFGTNAEKQLFYEVFNGRYNFMKPTVLISNLDLKKLEEFIGARVIDRAKDNGGKLFVCNWESFRGEREMPIPYGRSEKLYDPERGYPHDNAGIPNEPPGEYHPRTYEEMAEERDRAYARAFEIDDPPPI